MLSVVLSLIFFSIFRDIFKFLWYVQLWPSSYVVTVSLNECNLSVKLKLAERELFCAVNYLMLLVRNSGFLEIFLKIRRVMIICKDVKHLFWTLFGELGGYFKFQRAF